MIDSSAFCIVYYQEDCVPKTRKSGTKTALQYAILKNKRIILLPRLTQNSKAYIINLAFPIFSGSRIYNYH